MKKKLMTLAVLLMAAVTMNAQSIIGIWQADLPSSEFEFFMEFDESSQVSLVIAGDIKEEDMSAKVYAGVQGTYKLDGSTITFDINKKEPEIEIENLKLSGELEGKEEFVKSLLMKAMEGEKEELFSDYDFDKGTIVSLTDVTLEMKAEGDDKTVVFNKVPD
ncbi:MAG: hypothetical protein Q4E58_12815 [Prevotellaceae bacterium]|nr:hypothetical protein [Prevotellaceae bacterium]